MSSQTPPTPASPSAASPSATDTSALRVARLLLPIVVLAVGMLAWELVVRLNDIPPYVLPGPLAVLRTLVADWPVLSQSLLTTLLTTFEGFIAATVGGIGLALLFNQSKWLEYSLFPYAVILQVTPVIAIARTLRSRANSRRRTTSGVSPEKESARTVSPGTSMPRSP